MRRFDVVKVLAAGALMLSAAQARAEPTASEKAMAIQLFDDAHKQMAAGNYAVACQKYRDSQRLDPQLGTLLHLAECYEKSGKTASAWASFMDAIEVADKRGDPRAKPAREHATALRARLSMLTINVTSPMAPGIEVRLDGESLERAAWGLPEPVDPGSHKILANAPGRRPWANTVNVGANAAKVAVTVPELLAPPAEQPKTAAPPPTPKRASPAAKAPPAAPSKAPPVAPARPSSSPLPPPDTPPDEMKTNRGGTQRTIGVVVTALGAAGLAAGGVLGLTAKSKFNDAFSHCDGNQCDATGLALRHEAVSRGNLATIVVGVGAGVLAVGSIIWLAAPHGTTEVGLGPATVSVRGRF